MSIFTHVMVGTNDLDQARVFYDAVLGSLGIKRLPAMRDTAISYGRDKPEFMVTVPRNGEPATHANGGTIGFVADSPAAIDAFHANALANGGSCEGPPGPREFGPNLYAAYIRDPDGNKLCVYCFGAR